MNRHGTPDEGAHAHWYHVSIVEHWCVYGDSGFAESCLERPDSLRIQEFPDLCPAQTVKERSAGLQERLTVKDRPTSTPPPPPLTAGQPLGSSRLITKLRIHGGVSRAGQISYLGRL